MLNAVRLRIDLAYDGTGFYGWAKQPEIRTVQGEIERVLHTILRVPEGDPTEPLRLTVAGRTDTGVHASHQVCHLDVNEDVLKRCVGHMDVPPSSRLPADFSACCRPISQSAASHPLRTVSTRVSPRWNVPTCTESPIGQARWTPVPETSYCISTMNLTSNP